MARAGRSPLDWKLAAAGVSALVVGVGVVTESLFLAVGTAFFLLLAVGLVYPFARFAAETE